MDSYRSPLSLQIYISYSELKINLPDGGAKSPLIDFVSERNLGEITLRARDIPLSELIEDRNSFLLNLSRKGLERLNIYGFYKAGYEGTEESNKPFNIVVTDFRKSNSSLIS